MLSDRVRPEVEAAPWVIDEIKTLEAENAALKAQINRIKHFWTCQSPLSSHWHNARTQYFVDKVLAPIGEFLAGKL